MAERVLDSARRSGLVRAGEPLLVMLSGGADSVALLDVALRLGAVASALHVNYGFRAEAPADEEHCRELCAGLGVNLTVERVRLDGEAGNLQALARDARYGLAERHSAADYAAAHTASDQAETVLYRLATSPGRRALLGMEPRRGRLVRPLLEVTREEVRDYCRARSLAWREDASNSDPRFARSRARTDLLPALRALDPRAERAIAETALALRDEAEVLDTAAADALAGLGGGPAVLVAALAELPKGLARIVLRGLAEDAAGEQRALSRAEVDAILALGERGGTRSLELGGSLTAVVEYGTLRFRRGGSSGAQTPAPVALAVPGTARFGAWHVEASTGPAGDVAVAAAAIGGGPLTVRGWRDGDRMRPVGLGGTKTLQDLFTDRKVPRALRRTLPVVEAAGRIVWVAGLALDDRFAATPGDPGAVWLSARHLDSRR